MMKFHFVLLALIFSILTTYLLIRDITFTFTFSCVFSLCLWVVVFVLSLPHFLSHAVWLFLGSPGDIVLLSSLTNRHGQNESSSVLPKARLCPRGGLAGRISMWPAVSVHTDCDRPGAPLAPNTLNRIMQPCLHRRARSMGWTAHANSCQGDTLVQ